MVVPIFRNSVIVKYDMTSRDKTRMVTPLVLLEEKPLNDEPVLGKSS